MITHLGEHGRGSGKGHCRHHISGGNLCGGNRRVGIGRGHDELRAIVGDYQTMAGYRPEQVNRA